MAVPLGLFAALAIASNVIAASWHATVVIKPTPDGPDAVADVAADGPNVIVGYAALPRWRGDPADFRVYTRISSDSGDSFLPARRLMVSTFADARDLDVESGGGRHWAVWAEYRGSQQYENRWQVFIGRHGYTGTDAWDIIRVSNHNDTVRSPHVVYTPDRLVVAYEALVGGTYRLFVQTAHLDGAWDDDLFTPAADMGPAPSGRSISIDATPRTISLAWTDGYVNYRRATIGPAPARALSWQPTRRLAIGSMPVVVASGETVAVFYHQNLDALVRVSDDGGRTFAPAVTIEEGHPGCCGAAVHDAAIAGPRIVAIVAACDFTGCANRYTSTDRGATWSLSATGSNHWDGRHVAFTAAGGTRKLAEFWWSDRSFAEPDDERLLYHREE